MLTLFPATSVPTRSQGSLIFRSGEAWREGEREREVGKLTPFSAAAVPTPSQGSLIFLTPFPATAVPIPSQGSWIGRSGEAQREREGEREVGMLTSFPANAVPTPSQGFWVGRSGQAGNETWQTMPAVWNSFHSSLARRLEWPQARGELSFMQGAEFVNLCLCSASAGATCFTASCEISNSLVHIYTQSQLALHPSLRSSARDVNSVGRRALACVVRAWRPGVSNPSVLCKCSTRFQCCSRKKAFGSPHLVNM